MDDHPVYRDGLAALLTSVDGLEVVGTAADGKQALEATRELDPDVIVMDIQMPEMDGIEATRRIVAGDGDPPVRVLMLTTFDLDEYVFEALRAGASGFLLKDAPAEELAAAIRVVAAGDSLLAPGVTRRVIDAFPIARRARPGLRLVVVAGPRIDPATLPARDGLEIRGYVDHLDALLARCDLGITHGGLSTTMTLTAYRRPFLYVPLQNHFEQNRHVRHRLAAYGAGRCLDWPSLTPESLAAAIVAEVGRPVGYRPVETDGADRAAALLAEVL